MRKIVLAALALSACTPQGDWVDVDVGYVHTCGLHEDGSAECWGEDSYGETLAPADSFDQVCADYKHSCGLRTEGTLACWGKDDEGQASPPEGLFSEVACGFDQSCGITEAGELLCWGWSVDEIPHGPGFIDVSLGWEHGCAVREDGTLTCWGAAQEWWGGAPTEEDGFIAIDSGLAGSAALREDGGAAWWRKWEMVGADYVIPSGARFTALSVGSDWCDLIICALLVSGPLECWGYLDGGEATREGDAYFQNPRGEYQKVSVGYEHRCAITTRGAMVCSQDNEYQLDSPH